MLLPVLALLLQAAPTPVWSATPTSTRQVPFTYLARHRTAGPRRQ